MPQYFTGKGDDGTTGLLGDERVPKHHPRPEAYGALDEASAALGAARALAEDPELQQILLQTQRDLYSVMAEVAALPEHAARFREIDQENVLWLEEQVEKIGNGVEMPSGFVLPGDNELSAALDVARTVVRRSERRLSLLDDLENPALLAYVNRLSSLCFILALWAGSSTPAKTE